MKKIILVVSILISCFMAKAQGPTTGILSAPGAVSAADKAKWFPTSGNLSIADTAAMLTPYHGGGGGGAVDTLPLHNQIVANVTAIGNKVNISDTTTMLSKYTLKTKQSADSALLAARIQAQIDSATTFDPSTKLDKSQYSVDSAANKSSYLTSTSTNTLTNKRWTARVGSTTSSATPTINTDNYDIYKLTAQTAAITSFTTNLTGTPVDGDILEIQITGTAARALTWGASFVSGTVTLPTTTVTTATLTVVFQYFTTSSYGNNKWVCANSF